VHDVEDAVDDLVTPGPEKGGVEDLIAFGVDQPFIKPAVSPFSIARPARVIISIHRSAEPV
jgi:hypothetical protein